MASPIWQLWKLQMATAKKLALGALFSLATIDVIFDILRTINSVDGGAVALDTVWDVLEPCVAVIVSCLPVYRRFRALFQFKDIDTAKETPSAYKNLQGTHDRSIGQTTHDFGNSIDSGRREFGFSTRNGTLANFVPDRECDPHETSEVSVV